MKTLEKYILERLPHGSGIDLPWTTSLYVDDTIETLLLGNEDCTVQLYNSYHCMDSNGMYAGWVDFTAIVSVKFDFDSGEVVLTLQDIELSEANVKWVMVDYPDVLGCGDCEYYPLEDGSCYIQTPSRRNPRKCAHCGSKLEWISNPNAPSLDDLGDYLFETIEYFLR